MKNKHLFNIFLGLSSFALVVFSFSLLLKTENQKRFTDLLYPPERQILSTLETNLNIKSKLYRVIKIQQAKDLWLEFYDLKEKERLVAKFKLPSRLDGQMYVNKKTSNLFASDLDDDGVFEVVSPTFNIELEPHIHAFKYSLENGNFSQIPPEELLKLL